MSDLYGILESIRFYKEEVSLILGLLTVLYIFYGIGRAGSFIAEVAFEPQDGWFPRTINWLRGTGQVLLLSWYAPGLAFAFPRRRFIAARYYAELQILLPQKALPNRRDYNEHEYRLKLEGVLEEEANRRARIRNLLPKQLAEERSLLGVAVHWVRRKLGWMKGQEEEPLGPVEIEDFPQLDDSRTKIKRYFEALERRSMDESDDATKFLTEARFKSGYVAPIFLITGLVNRFADDDGWKLVLNNYRRLIESDASYSEELRELRSFLFNCWLLWGPSIQPCSCEYWKRSQQGPAADGDLMIQYGYGDENNSIDILVKGGLGPHFKTTLEAILNKGLTAAPFVATGRFRWGPSLSDAEICTAQALVRGGSDPAQRQPLHGRVILECPFNEVTVADLSRSSRYYSAYLWIVFVIQKPEGDYFPEKPWKNLLVFFEHGNIAHADTYHTLKEQLIAKTCKTLSKVLSEVDAASTTTGPVRLKYACSFDDTNCGAGHKALFQSHTPGRPSQDITILSMLRRRISELPDGHVLKSDRLLLPPAIGLVEANEYSSCHLPEIVEKFYAELEIQMQRAS